MRVTVAAVAVSLGCGGRGPRVSAEPPPEADPVSIQLTTEVPVAADSQLVLAYRDGDAPWRTIDPHGALSFPVEAGRYTLLIACPQTSDKVIVRYLTTEDPPPDAIDPCQPKPLGSIRGIVEGRQGADAVVFARTEGDVEKGWYFAIGLAEASDLVVLAGARGQREWQTTRMTIVRDVPVSRRGLSRVDVDLEETGVDVAHEEIRMIGLAEDEGVRLMVGLETANRSYGFVTLDRTPPYIADLPPASLLLDTDRVTVTAIASDGRGQRKGTREGDTFVFPPPLGEVTAELVSREPPRLHFAWPAYDGAKVYQLGAKQFPRCEEDDCETRYWTAVVSARYLGDAASFTHEMEDLRDVAAWFGFRADTKIEWEVFAWDAADTGASRRGFITP